MNDPFNDIGKKLPYNETEQYLDKLIDRATENAIMRQSQAAGNRQWHWLGATAAAIALLIVGVGVTVMLHNSSKTTTVTMSDNGPIDNFLSTLSDEEVAMLPYFEIEEIPEY